MAKRYIGDATITLAFDERASTSSQNKYRGTVRAGGKTWKFSDLGASPHDSRTLAADSPVIFDRLARAIISFAVNGDAPESVRAAIEDATAGYTNESGEYMVRRSAVRKNPTRKRRTSKRTRS